MKVINFNVKAEQIEIVPLADLHIGDPHSNWKSITQRVEYIRSTPYVYTLLGGDLMDNGTKTSIGDVYDQSAKPGEQLNLLHKLLQPLADANKIIACVGGNHEARTYKNDGIDLTEQLCARLNILDRQSPETALIAANINGIQYKIYLTHGSGGGRALGGKINRLESLSKIVTADVYIMGHTHTPIVTREAKMELIKGKLQRHDMLFVNLAASLDYGGYGEIQGYTPASVINPSIYLSGRNKYAWAAL